MDGPPGSGGKEFEEFYSTHLVSGNASGRFTGNGLSTQDSPHYHSCEHVYAFDIPGSLRSSVNDSVEELDHFPRFGSPSVAPCPEWEDVSIEKVFNVFGSKIAALVHDVPMVKLMDEEPDGVRIARNVAWIRKIRSRLRAA